MSNIQGKHANHRGELKGNKERLNHSKIENHHDKHNENHHDKHMTNTSSQLCMKHLRLVLASCGLQQAQVFWPLLQFCCLRTESCSLGLAPPLLLQVFSRSQE